MKGGEGKYHVLNEISVPRFKQQKKVRPFYFFGCWNNNNYKKDVGVDSVMKKLQQSSSPEFYIVGGDNYYPIKKKSKTEGTKKYFVESQFVKGMQYLNKLSRKAPLYLLMGNHDLEYIDGLKSCDDKLNNCVPVHQCHIINKQLEYKNDFIMNKLFKLYNNTLILFLNSTYYTEDTYKELDNHSVCLNIYNKGVKHNFLRGGGTRKKRRQKNKTRKNRDSISMRKSLSRYGRNSVRKTSSRYNRNSVRNTNDINLSFDEWKNLEEDKLREIVANNLHVKNIVLIGHHPILTLRDKEKMNKAIVPLTKDGIDFINEIYDNFGLDVNKYWLCADVHQYQYSTLTIGNNKIEQYVVGTGGTTLDNEDEVCFIDSEKEIFKNKNKNGIVKNVGTDLDILYDNHDCNNNNWGYITVLDTGNELDIHFKRCR